MAKKTSTLTVRLSQELRDKLEAARTAIPYQPSVTSIIERGIVLAIRELEVMSKAGRAALKEEEGRG